MNQDKIYVPPIKIQGIKTKLVPLIQENVQLDPDTVWVEPFMGSGVVGFNIRPQRAIFADINPHIINFYNAIKSKSITSYSVRAFLEDEGKKLQAGDGAYYYEVRSRFNETHSPLDFLFLNRSCFNGMIRFNKNYQFNVPYGHKPQRFSKSYITKIVNQVKHIEELLDLFDWTFNCCSYEETISSVANEKAFFYCDPPYIGRHVDYYDSWDESSENRLKELLCASGESFMLSTWDFNQYRKNTYIDSTWGFCRKISKDHFYYVGAKEVNRKPMMEALLINYSPEESHNNCKKSNELYQFVLSESFL